jgi:hypothetical protein
LPTGRIVSIWAIVYFGQLWATFSTVNSIYYFDKNIGFATFWVVKKTSGHPARHQHLWLLSHR